MILYDENGMKLNSYIWDNVLDIILFGVRI